jgi:two-component system sensor histidine kinase/response regulator
MASARPRILIVDDQAANIDVLAEALGEPYELFAATTAERAVELAGTGVDLILLDVVMPDQNGFELCRALKTRAHTRNIPVIFVTALGEVEDEARGFEVGGVDYITKPISPPTVRARVRTHLELRGAQERLEREALVLAENLRLKEHVERLSRHDLKTPLTSVISIPQILLETPGFDDDQVRMLRAVESAGYRILDMVNRSLDLFRMESGAYEFRPERVDFRELAERVSLDLAGLARERGVRFEIVGDRGEPAMAQAEELLSYSMLANIVKNAVEASPKGSVVRIEIEGHAGVIRTAVRNRGAVPEALRDRFFRKYASSGKRTGTGLGTYSARLMAETQRGRIEMSTSQEMGTVVSVSLEAAGSAAGVPVTSMPTAEIRGQVLPQVRVLIADDDEPTRFVLARFLGDAAAIAFAEDGHEAVRKAAAFDPSVVLLDAEMPGLDGFAAATALRNAEEEQGHARRLLIGLSSHDDSATRASFLSSGCDLVLVKPVARATILAAVSSLASFKGQDASAGLSPKETVFVDADLLPMIPAFLESRKEQAVEMAGALAKGDLERARGLAHKLRGGLEMCGFAKAGALSRSIEEALSGGPAEGSVEEQTRALRAYLDEVRYEAKALNP